MESKPNLSERKVCPSCHESKLLSEYHRSKANSRGIQSRCKLCQKEYTKLRKTSKPKHYASLQKSWRQRNPERDKLINKRAAIKAAYGLSLEDVDAMLSTQGHSCLICGSTTSSGRNWHIDHCHTTNQVRGILCHHCNVGLGHFKDDPEILSSAINYLNKFNHKETK